MSQNHLGDANGSSACLPISLSLCKMFCSSDSLQIPSRAGIWQSAVCNSIVKGRHMYDIIFVTPGEYFSFIEFCDLIRKYAYKSPDREKFDYDLIVNVDNTNHAQSLSKLQQVSRFSNIPIVPPKKAMTIFVTSDGFLLVDTHINNDRGFIMVFLGRRIGLT